MRLPQRLTQWLADFLIGRFKAGKLHPHDEGDIVTDDGLYMERRWLVVPRWWTLGCGARVHHTVRSDGDRHLHDHPWWNISVILRGSYFEEMPVIGGGEWHYDKASRDWRECTVSALRLPGRVVFRRAEDRHRLTIGASGGCWSLFIVGPRRRLWGFRTGPTAWQVWYEYLYDKEKLQ